MIELRTGNPCCPHCELPCPTWGNGHAAPCTKCNPWLEER